jgi:hypothetical protein
MQGVAGAKKAQKIIYTNKQHKTKRHYEQEILF